LRDRRAYFDPFSDVLRQVALRIVEDERGAGLGFLEIGRGSSDAVGTLSRLTLALIR
jgi:hypothetical protein